MGSTGVAADDEPCAADDDASVSSDGLAAAARLGVGTEMLGRLALPSIDGAATSAVRFPDAMFVTRVPALEFGRFWLTESAEGRLSTACGDELGDACSGIAAGIGGRATRSVNVGVDPAKAAFLAELFPAGIPAGVAAFPVGADPFAGNCCTGAAE